jgi:putative membrane protein
MNGNNTWVWTLAMASLIGFSSATRAQTAPAPHSTAGQASRSDQQFMTEAAQSEHAGLEVAMTALRRASNVQARNVAQALVQDHERLTQELQALAATKAVTLPDDSSGLQSGQVEMLQRIDDAAFDRRYAELLVALQQRAIKLFGQAARQAEDADVRAWAKASLPVLEHHLQMARYLKASLD